MSCKKIIISDTSSSLEIKESLKSHIYEFSNRTLIHDYYNKGDIINSIASELENHTVDLAIIFTPGVMGIEKIKTNSKKVRPAICWNIEVAKEIKWESNYIFVPVTYCNKSEIIQFLHEIIF